MTITAFLWLHDSLDWLKAFDREIRFARRRHGWSRNWKPYLSGFHVFVNSWAFRMQDSGWKKNQTITAIFTWISLKIHARIKSWKAAIRHWKRRRTAQRCVVTGHCGLRACIALFLVFQQAFQRPEQSTSPPSATDAGHLSEDNGIHSGRCTDWGGNHRLYPDAVCPELEKLFGVKDIRIDNGQLVFPRRMSKDEQAMVRVITPYIQWAIDNGMTSISLGDERRRLEKQRYIYEQHIAGNKRQNLIKKACMAIVNGIHPYIDRIINESTETDSKRIHQRGADKGGEIPVYRRVGYYHQRIQWYSGTLDQDEARYA